MSDIGAWLTALGLGKYTSAFESAEIEADTVALLTEDDLRELGLPLGPRRRIIAARTATAEVQATPALIADADVHARTVPERRQLTVMFADLVNSTVMSVTYDPEELNELLTRYRQAVVAEVQRHGGTIAKYMGDGILAYFGWPLAREDADEDCIRAALAAVRAVGAIAAPDGHPLQSRVGIATGLVVVGGVTGTGTAREDQVAGEALNLAARLQSVADPDMVVVSDSTYRLAGQRFSWRSLGEVEVKGFDARMPAWQPVAEQVHASRFAAARTVRSALIGRDDELQLLQGRWRDACELAGATVLIVGEAGLGKSRLTEAFESGIPADAAARVRLQCSAFHQNNALYPVIEYLSGAADIDDGDDPPSRLAKLEALLSQVADSTERALPLIADLLSIPASAGYELPGMLPAQRRAALIAILAEWLAGQADRQPLLLVLEDAHWADATTLELMNRLVGMANTTAMLVLVTSRPEFASPWSGRPRVDVIGLDRLPDSDCERLVAALTEARGVLPATIEQIIAKSDGNPLFLEELSLAVLDARAHLERQLVPDTLQGSLMARLDGLGEAKLTAQTASVLGRRFARPLLLKVAKLNPHMLDADLSLLVASGIIYPLGRVSDGRYEFKHALVRDAAYGSLLMSRRRELHGACATLLERDFAEVAQNEPELLAHHFGEAGEHEQASRYHEASGDRAGARFAFVEAIASYRDAVRQLELTADDRARDRHILALLLKTGPAQCIIFGPQAAAVQATYDRAQPLALRVDDYDSRFRAVWGLWFNANVGRRFARATGLAEELVTLSRTGGEEHVLEGLHCRWSTDLFSGDYARGVRNADQGIAIYDRERHHRLGSLFGGHDPGVCAYCVRGVGLIFAGSGSAGLDAMNAALSLAEALDHPHSLGHALQNCLTASIVVRDHEEVATIAERLHGLGTRYNFPPLRLLADQMLGWVEIQAGNRNAGLARMEAGFATMIASAAQPAQGTAIFADELVKAGRFDDALAVLAAQYTGLGRPEAGHYLSEMFRVQADALAALDRATEAAAAYDVADRIALSQGAHWLRLRIASGRIRSASGDAHARGQLTAILAIVDTNVERPDLVEARELLSP